MMRHILALLFVLATAFGAVAQPADFDANGNPWGAVYLSKRIGPNISGTSSTTTSYQLWPVLTAASAATIAIPACDSVPITSTAWNPQYDQIIYDASGNAGTNNITIAPPFGLINGNVTYTISANNDSAWIHWTGGGCNVIASGARSGVPFLSYALNQSGAGTSINLTGGQTIGATTLTVASETGFPSVAPYVVIVGSEQEQVTGGIGTKTLTVTRSFNSTTATAHPNGSTVQLGQQITTINQGGGIGSGDATVTVTSFANFPSSGNYIALLGSSTPPEHVLVTSGQGTLTWTITRGIDGTPAASHANGAQIYLLAPSTAINQGGGIASGDTSFVVSSSTGFPATGCFLAQLESEHIAVCTVAGTTWSSVTRNVNGTLAASHANGTPILFLDSKCQNIPANSAIFNILEHNNSSQAVQGGLDFGTTPGGIDIATAVALGPLGYNVTPGESLLKQFVSNVAVTPVCVSPHTTWNTSLPAIRVLYGP